MDAKVSGLPDTVAIISRDTKSRGSTGSVLACEHPPFLSPSFFLHPSPSPFPPATLDPAARRGDQEASPHPGD